MKKTITTITLAVVMTFTATFANAGIMLSDKTAPTASCSETKDGIIIGNKDGIIIGNIVAIFSDLMGILVADKQAPCTQSRDGIMVSD